MPYYTVYRYSLGLFVLGMIIEIVTGASHFRTVSVVIGGTAKLPCRVSLQGNIDVLWQGPMGSTLANNLELVTHDGRVSVRHPSSRKWTLQIRDVTTTDRGNYTCNIGTTPITRKIIMLDLHYPPKISAFSSDMMIGLGDDATMSCDAVGVPTPKVTWFKVADGDEDGVYISEGSTLTLTNISQEDSGRYKCIAENEILPDANRVISLSVQAPPIVTAVHPVVHQSLGIDAVLSCMVTAYPEPKTHWYRSVDGQRLLETTGDRYSKWQQRVDDHRQMVQVFIRAVESLDFGDYVCAAENRFGSGNVTVQLKELMVHGSRIVKPPTDIITPLGRRALLTCLVDGTRHHDNVIWWRHLVNGSRDERIFESNPSSDDGDIATVSPQVVRERFEVVGRYSLAVKNVRWEDSGNYTCQLQGRSERSAKLTTMAPPVCEIANDNQTAITFLYNNIDNSTAPTTTITLRVGDHVTLQCRVRFSQALATRWSWHVDWQRYEARTGETQNLASVHDDNVVPTLIQRRLTFVATGSDAGRYMCVVHHRLLNYTASCDVTINVSLTDDDDDVDDNTKKSLQNSTSVIEPKGKSSVLLGLSSLSLILVAVCFGLVLLFCAIVICVVMHYRKKIDKQRQRPVNRRYGNNGGAAIAMERDSLMGQRRSNIHEVEL